MGTAGALAISPVPGHKSVSLFLNERHIFDRIDRFAGLVGKVGRPGFRHIGILIQLGCDKAASIRKVPIQCRDSDV